MFTRLLSLFCAALLFGCSSNFVEPDIYYLTPPTQVGTAPPTPTMPLSAIKGIKGKVPSASPATAEKYAKNFESLAFQSERGDSFWWVTKWNKPIWYFGLSMPKELRNDFWHAANVLSHITGLQFTERNPYNVEVRLGSGQFLKTLGDERHCFATYQIDKYGAVERAIIYVGLSFDSERRSECAIEELSQILGPINDTTLVEESLWRPHSRIGLFSSKTYHWLTWHDAIILRVLYNERIKPGMHRDEAMPIVRELIAKELKALNEAAN